MPTSQPTTAPAPPTPKGRRTEAAFRAAARRVFARDGYPAAKVSDIAAEAGRSLGSFYNYFTSKEHVLAALAEEFKVEVDRRLAAVDRSDPLSYATLEEEVRVFFRVYRDHAPALAGVFQASMMNEVFAERWRDIRGDARDALARRVRMARRAGRAADLDPEIAASALGAMMDYFCYVWLAGGGERGRSELDEELAVRTLARIWFHALGGTPTEESPP